MADEVTIGLCGLSRSGKTTLITAFGHLLHNLNVTDAKHDGIARLLSAHASPDHRAGFFHDKTVTKAKIPPRARVGSGRATFPYEQYLGNLLGSNTASARPEWPQRTAELSEFTLTVSYRKTRRLLKWLPAGEHSGQLTLRLLDYPGEWIIDLSLLSQDYDDWCRHCAVLFDSEPLAGIDSARSWAAHCRALDPAAPSSEEEVNRLANGYQALLRELHEDELTLTLLPPGRLITESAEARGDISRFFPLIGLADGESAVQDGTDHALGTILQDRFERYKADVVRPFNREYFSRIRDQIILVDCIKAIEAGQAGLQSLTRSLSLLLRAFHYSERNAWFARLAALLPFGRPSIQRLYLVATKADLIAKPQVRQLSDLLRLLSADITEGLPEVPCRHYAVAAVRTTEWCQYQGHECIRGELEDGEHKAVAPPPWVIPGNEVAVRTARPYRFMRFRPPGADPRYGNMVPNLGVDALLNDILVNYG